MEKISAIEQRGVCAGGKKPTARSIKQVYQTFRKFDKPHSGAKNILSRCAALPEAELLWLSKTGFEIRMPAEVSGRSLYLCIKRYDLRTIEPKEWLR